MNYKRIIPLLLLISNPFSPPVVRPKRPKWELLLPKMRLWLQ